nr:hypothetical protein [Tanacetum cinerariifolium]
MAAMLHVGGCRDGSGGEAWWCGLVGVEMVAPAVTVAETDVVVGPWCFDGGVGGDMVERVTWVIKVAAVEMVTVAVVVDSGGVMEAAAGDGGGWQPWLLWMAVAAMIETSGGAWRRVMDLIDRDTRSHFGVCRKISPEKLSGGVGGGRRRPTGGRRRLPEIGGERIGVVCVIIYKMK